jgi:hypothetical protein
MSTTLQVNKSESSLSSKVAIVLANRQNKPNAIHADSAGNLPTRFPLLKVGYWHTQDHGDIMISPSDLQEYYDHSVQGYGRSGGEDGQTRSKLPINFGHEYRGKAAGWFNIALEGDTLWAVDVEWSDAGKQGIIGKEWKFISAEFYPVGRGGWPDPLDYTNFIENVIDGAALTNIPLFYILEPVMASRANGVSSDKSPGIFLVNANQEKEHNSMDLKAILAKSDNEVTEAEKTFVAQNKEQLTADDQKRFGLEVTAAPAADPKPADPAPNTNKPKEDEEVSEVTEKQEAAVAASLKKKGFVVVQADRLQQLETTATSYEKEKATNIVKAHIGRGVIVADQEKAWVDKLMASRGKERDELESMLSAIPSSAAFNPQNGADESRSGDATAVAEELKEKTLKVQADAQAKGKDLTYGQAQDQLLRTDNELKTRVEAARK